MTRGTSTQRRGVSAAFKTLSVPAVYLWCPRGTPARPLCCEASTSRTIQLDIDDNFFGSRSYGAIGRIGWFIVDRTHRIIEVIRLDPQKPRGTVFPYVTIAI